MDIPRLFEIIDSLEEEYIGFWADVSRLESPTSDKAGVDAVGAYFRRAAEKKGWHVTVHPEAVSGDAVAITLNPDAPGEPVCFSGHIDTVHPVGSFGPDPVKIEDGWIFGPGTVDCKGGAVAGFMAMDALERAGFAKRPVRLILQPDEETSSRGSEKRTVDFMEEQSRGAAAFLNLEPMGDPPAEKVTAVLARKGIVRYRLTVFGKAIHSASCYAGVSAVAEAAHKILELEKMKDPKGLTCNCSMLAGGSSPNSVPDMCTFTADIRFPDAAALAEAEETVRRIAETAFVAGSRCEVSEVSRRASMEWNERNTGLLRRVNRVMAANGLPEITAISSAGGSDAADMTTRGIPTLDSLGVRGSGIHSVREKGRLRSLAECAKRSALIAAEL